MNYIFWWLFLFLVPLFFACNQHGGKNEIHQTILEKIKAAEKKMDNKMVDREYSLDTNTHIAVDSAFTSERFFVLQRSSRIERFPCSRCHSTDLDKLKREARVKQRWAHRDMEFKHATGSVMKCGTCHNMSRMDDLVSLTNTTININHSYLLCAQCHNTQAKDWIGGAHGKRLRGWIGPRVVKNCTDCHNPHKPGFDKRWPSYAPKIVHE